MRRRTPPQPGHSLLAAAERDVRNALDDLVSEARRQGAGPGSAPPELSQEEAHARAVAISSLRERADVLICRYAAMARPAGRNWHEIGDVLGLHQHAVVSKLSVAEEAYGWACDGLPGWPDAEFAWTCPACGRRVTDHGPYPRLPDRELGHRGDCPRWTAELDRWDNPDRLEAVTGFVAAPGCAACGERASRVEVVAPGALPAAWAVWDQHARDSHNRRRDPAQWWLLFEGTAAGNGGGDQITAGRAAQLARAFTPPFTFKRIRTAGLYDDAGFCGSCDEAYCYRHWHVSPGGYGTCPQGHGKSLDPHWSPEDYDP